jgi:hypothetical protein
MLLTIALLVSGLAPQSGPPTPTLCRIPWQWPCCIQVIEEWQTYCSGAICEGMPTSSGFYQGSTIASPGQSGFALAQSELVGNGSRCRFREVWCDDGFCVMSPEWSYWECHNEILEGQCQG